MSEATVTSAVAEALGGLRRAFPEAQIAETSDASGGLFVIIEPIQLGPEFSPKSTWLGMHLSPLLPDADTYPLYIGGGVTRADGSPITDTAIQSVAWQSRSALQLSRRSTRHDAAVSTPALKAGNVIAWFRSL
ncbi:hypothetical protein [Promicromonospora panici]|uniref:hypothetical protein n=1 Tax=Promicromonospora panici TaxID=2219658 RepID=UPI00101C3D74|nr:hypothetical protein [Promicromonospora panici]